MPPAKNYFDLLFVGLFCFKKDDRVAVMPDGRNPQDQTIPPHVPFIVVDPEDVVESQSSGWEENNPALTEEGVYTIDKCTIEITKATTPGLLNATQHDRDIVNLSDVDQSFHFADDLEKTIAEITIGQGRLQLFRRPDADQVARDGGTVSRLRVPYDHDVDGDIKVTVTIAGQARVLALKPAADIAICNEVLDDPLEDTGNPFKLFGQISKNGTFDPAGQLVRPGVPAIGGHYQVFKLHHDVGEGGSGGGTTGCCPPF